MPTTSCYTGEKNGWRILHRMDERICVPSQMYSIRPSFPSWNWTDRNVVQTQKHIGRRTQRPFGPCGWLSYLGAALSVRNCPMKEAVVTKTDTIRYKVTAVERIIDGNG